MGGPTLNVEVKGLGEALPATSCVSKVDPSPDCITDGFSSEYICVISLHSISCFLFLFGAVKHLFLLVFISMLFYLVFF